MGALAKLHLSVSSTEAPAREVHQVQPDLHRRTFLRVPTHAISVAEDRRRSPRACLSLPLQLTSIEGRSEPAPVTLVTKNISSSGIYFLAPRHIEPGTAIELQVALIERPLGRGSVRLKTAAHVVRIDDCDVPGWFGFAASFDDIDFDRDDVVPSFNGFH
ncbi:MAG: PilZ domain-containing protein [Candidatus Acidiferrales bacterium]